ncbi:MAG: hypothetical protein OQJ89_00805, partial [Kangiellaceae bacterium]|nr:hypothetical protein [Kangiellaceae bacterium]
SVFAAAGIQGGTNMGVDGDVTIGYHVAKPDGVDGPAIDVTFSGVGKTGGGISFGIDLANPKLPVVTGAISFSAGVKIETSIGPSFAVVLGQVCGSGIFKTGYSSCPTNVSDVAYQPANDKIENLDSVFNASLASLQFWGVNADGAAVAREAGEAWQTIDTDYWKPKRLSVRQDGFVWALDEGGTVWARPKVDYVNWWRIIGVPALKDIAGCPDGTTLGLDYDGNVYKRAKDVDWNTAWDHIQGLQLSEIHCGKDSGIWGIGAGGKVYQKATNDNSTWWYYQGPQSTSLAVCTNDGRMWTTTPSGEVLTRPIGPWDLQWTSAGGNFKKVTCGSDGIVWAESSEGETYYRELNDTTWTFFDGEVTQVGSHVNAVLSNKDLWAVDSNGGAVARKAGEAWKSIDTDYWKPKRLDVRQDGLVWALDEGGTVWARPKVDYVNWWRIMGVGVLKDIAGCPDGTTLGLDYSGNVYKRAKDADWNTAWNHIPGLQLSEIECGKNSGIWGVDISGRIHQKATHDNFTWWYYQGPQSTSLAVCTNDGRMWTTTSNGDIFTRPIGPWDLQWTKVDGTLKTVSCGSNGVVWGENEQGGTYYRAPGDDAWTFFDDKFRQVRSQ